MIVRNFKLYAEHGEDGGDKGESENESLEKHNY